MCKLIVILPFFLVLSLNAQPKYSVRDINAKGYFQIENVSHSNFADWNNLTKDRDYNFKYYRIDQSEPEGNFYNFSEGNACIAMNMSVFRNSKLEEDLKLIPHWQFSLMFVRENFGNSFNQNSRTSQGFESNSLNLNYINNLVRIEMMRLWRSDDSKKAFVAFGIGTQFGLSYDSEIEIFEYQSSPGTSPFDNFSSTNSTLDAKTAMTSMIFLPIDVNVRIVENLFLQLELRTGLKNLLVFDGPSFIYPIYGIGIGTRYVL